jgi:hypothetical protein
MRFALLCLLLSATTMYAGMPPTTTSVINDMVDQSIASIFSSVGKGHAIRVMVSDHPDADWIRSIALTKAAQQSDPLSMENVAVRIVIRDLSTRYEMMDDADSVRRIITCDMAAIIDENGVERSFVPPTEQDTVLCLRQEALARESRQHKATYGDMPDMPSSFWDDVLEPAIFVAAAVVTVVLLFTVRSQ